MDDEGHVGQAGEGVGQGRQPRHCHKLYHRMREMSSSRFVDLRCTVADREKGQQAGFVAGVGLRMPVSVLHVHQDPLPTSAACMHRDCLWVSLKQLAPGHALRMSSRVASTLRIGVASEYQCGFPRTAEPESGRVETQRAARGRTSCHTPALACHPCLVGCDGVHGNFY